MKTVYVIERLDWEQRNMCKYVAAAVTHDGAKSIMNDLGYDETTHQIVPVSVLFHGKYLRSAYMYTGYKKSNEGYAIDSVICSDPVSTMHEAKLTPIWRIVQKICKDNPGKYYENKGGQIMPTSDHPPFHVSENKMVAGIDRIRVYKV
jgi:hypothetical protein